MEFDSFSLALRLCQMIKRGEKHPYYDRVTELAELYTKLITGENMDSLMQQFTPRETPEMFEQRKRITQHITKTVANNVMDVFFKIPRSNSVQRNISYSDNDIKKLKELNKKLSEFWGDMSLDDYMNTRWFELLFTDPNAFVVVEWDNFDNSTERALPYPYEVSSHNAILYEYENNDLQFLVAQNSEMRWAWNDSLKKDEQKEQLSYTIYGKNQSVKFVQILSDKIITDVINNNRSILNDERNYGFIPVMEGDVLTGGYFIESVHERKGYVITVPTPHKLGYVPAQRIGTRRDITTNGNTFLSPIDKAVPIFMKLVKSNSEFDLTMALHCFPQKIQYAPRCKARDCRDGMLTDGSQCTACKGTGFETITSAQETITISLPKDREDMVDLTNMILYISPPVDLVRFQDDYIEKLTYIVKESIFNTELFSKQEVSETATGKNISLQNIYDSLYPIAQSYSKQWYFLVTTVADVTQLNKNLIAFYNFSKDFKLKSLSDLYVDLKMVGDARASEFVKDSIESDIAGIIYSEDERSLLKYNIKRAFFPFTGKSDEEIRILITSPGIVSQRTKVFYANFGIVFDSVEMAQAESGVDFYYLSKQKQYELIQAEVDRIMATLEEEQPEEPEIETSEEETTEEETTEE